MRPADHLDRRVPAAGRGPGRQRLRKQRQHLGHIGLPSKAGKAVTASSPVAATGKPAAGWTLPGADLANTRDVASPITSTNVSKLGVAWTVPLHTDVSHSDGAYATTPVVVNGVVYVQDLQSNVMAIRLATGKVLWTHTYDSPNGGPDGVNVAGGVVYGATNHAAFALDAATGSQLWSRTVIGNDHEGIDMTPGYNHGTVYVSTVPVNPTVGEYLGGGKATLWALNAATGAPEWSWDEVQDLWGRPSVNSGGGQWYAPSFDAQGNVYIGVANPAPLFGTKSYPLGSSRPGPDLYTDSVVKLSPHGKLLWYYQLTPHDLYDWDLQNTPVLTTANGRPVVVDGGKAGILFELDAKTGQLLWKLPVGGHDGHENDGLLTENAKPGSHAACPRGSASSRASSAASRPSWPATARPRSPPSTTSRCPRPGPATPRGWPPTWRPSKRLPARWSRSTRTPARSNGTPRSRPRRTAPPR